MITQGGSLITGLGRVPITWEGPSPIKFNGTKEKLWGALLAEPTYLRGHSIDLLMPAWGSRLVPLKKISKIVPHFWPFCTILPGSDHVIDYAAVTHPYPRGSLDYIFSCVFIP